MAHINSLNVHGCKVIRARALTREDTSWVNIGFTEPNENGHFDHISVFMDLTTAQAYADAINAVADRLQAAPVASDPLRELRAELVEAVS